MDDRGVLRPGVSRPRARGRRRGRDAWRLVEKRADGGIYHCVNSGFATWHEDRARDRCTSWGSPSNVIRLARALRACAVARPLFSALSNEKLANAGSRPRALAIALERAGARCAHAAWRDDIRRRQAEGRRLAPAITTNAQFAARTPGGAPRRDRSAAAPGRERRPPRRRPREARRGRRQKKTIAASVTSGFRSAAPTSAARARARAFRRTSRTEFPVSARNGQAGVPAPPRPFAKGGGGARAPRRPQERELASRSHVTG